jgi:hypothetical protein
MFAGRPTTRPVAPARRHRKLKGPTLALSAASRHVSSEPALTRAQNGRVANEVDAGSRAARAGKQKVTSGGSLGRHARRSAARCGALRSAADGSDGTRTRDLRRDSAALTRLNPLQIAHSVSERVPRTSPFYASQHAASERMRPQARIAQRQRRLQRRAWARDCCGSHRRMSAPTSYPLPSP